MIIQVKIKGIPADFTTLPFGRQIEHLRTIEEFKMQCKSTHLSQKRQSYKKAIKEAVALRQATEYYCKFNCDSFCKDDSFQFWYR